MRVGVLGRSKRVLNSFKWIHENGHKIVFVATDEHSPGSEIGIQEFEEFAKEIGAEFIVTRKLHSPENIELIKSLEPDIGISGNWLTLVKEEVINLFPFGILNAHAGDLPRFKGNAASNWAILNGEKEVVVTIHQMSSGLDSGDILHQKKLELNDNVYISDIRGFIEENLPEMFLKTLNGLNDGSIIPRPQSSNPADTLRVYSRMPVDGKLDWNKSAEELCRIVRASGRPFLGAYTYIGTEKVTIWKARVEYPEFNILGHPGQVAERYVYKNEVAIITGDGFLVIEEVETQRTGVLSPTLLINTIHTRLGMDYDSVIEMLILENEKLRKLLNS